MQEAFWLPLAWLLVSLALQVGWQGLSQTLGQKKSLRVSETLRLFSQGWPGAAARFFYFVGLPYLAVISGVLTPRLLGLKGVEYFVLTGEAETLAAPFQQALALTLLEWLLDSQLLIPLSLLACLFLASIRRRLSRDRIASASVPGTTAVTWTAPKISVLAVIYTGLHWAFYRAIFWAVTGDLYLGLVWGASAVLIEWLLVGWIQKLPPFQIPAFFIQLMLLILTSLLFFYTPNLWLIWPVHLALLAVLAYQNPEVSARPLISS